MLLPFLIEFKEVTRGAVPTVFSFSEEYFLFNELVEMIVASTRLGPDASAPEDGVAVAVVVDDAVAVSLEVVLVEVVVLVVAVVDGVDEVLEASDPVLDLVVGTGMGSAEAATSWVGNTTFRYFIFRYHFSLQRGLA